jgi:hypothetical protein
MVLGLLDGGVAKVLREMDPGRREALDLRKALALDGMDPGAPHPDVFGFARATVATREDHAPPELHSPVSARGARSSG